MAYVIARYFVRVLSILEEEDALNLKSSVLVCLPKHGGRDLPALVSIP